MLLFHWKVNSAHALIFDHCEYYMDCYPGCLAVGGSRGEGFVVGPGDCLVPVFDPRSYQGPSVKDHTHQGRPANTNYADRFPNSTQGDERYGGRRADDALSSAIKRPNSLDNRSQRSPLAVFLCICLFCFLQVFK